MSNSENSGRFRLRARRALLAVSTVLCSGAIVPAFAQVAAPAPVRSNIDGNGVDLFLGTMNVDGPTLSAGDGNSQGLTWQKLARGQNGFGDTLVGTLVVTGGKTYIAFGGVTHAFTSSGSTYSSTEGDGSTLTKSGSTYTYTAADGTVAMFTSVYIGAYPYGNIQGNVTSVTRPNGTRFAYTYDSARYCAVSKEGSEGQICTQRRYTYRIASVASNAQYILNFQYGNDASSFDQDDPTGNDFTGWGDITGVALKNAATGGGTRSQSFSWSNAGFTITDAMGRATTYRFASYQGPAAGAVTGITRPGSSGEDVTATYDSAGRVFTLSNATGTTTYTYSDSGNARTTTVTDPSGHATSYVFDIALQRPRSVTTATGNTTTNAYDGYGRITQITAPESNYTTFAYDGHGNVTQTQVVAKPGSGAPTLTTSASYPCTSTATCSKPVWTKDANGSQTDYGYDAGTGNVTLVTAPAGAGGVRATTSYTYTTVNGIQMVSGSSTCSIAASCAGTANETRSSIGYNANGLPTTATSAAGDGSISATTTRSYDDVGNVIAIDGPLPGSGDTVTYRYDADREVVGIVGPDPDGAGPRVRAAQRNTYDAKGRLTLGETGTVSDAGDGAWNGFAAAQGVATSYDGADRPLTRTLVAGGTTYSTLRYGYDRQRLDTVTVAMNGQGADRTTRYGYDSADRQTRVTGAYGTAEQSDDVTVSYTPNGRVKTQADANGNVTTYGYDGLDRVVRVTYPGGSYDQASYDAAGNVTQRRLRDGQVIGYGYDALGRLVSKDLPGSEADSSYSYDLLGHLKVVRMGSLQHGLAWDALGRKLTESQPFGSIGYQYDSAGRRTRETWADGFYVSYDYDAAGNMTAIRENGGAALVTLGYDDLGRRTSLTRGNGTVTGYTYDAAARLAQLSHYRNAGGALEQRYSYGYNPAGQIVSRVTGNDAYAWQGAYNVDRSYGVNGLNQLTSAGGVPLGYDGRGNLVSSGSTNYSYTSENMLKGVSNGTTLYYDGLGRLVEYDTNVSMRFLYDGQQMAAEYLNGSGSVARRYVYGPGADEPLVWYEGSGTGDRRWLHADERGSIVAVTNDAGNAIAINRYDEFGIPQSGNMGRFQYTGQAFLGEIGLSYYKARMYSPTLGRFLQTDPIGYGDGMNWYNYVGSDPVNLTDPTGLDPAPEASCGPDEIWDSGTSKCVPAPDVVVTGKIPHLPNLPMKPAIPMLPSGGDSIPAPSGGTVAPQNDIVVVARRTTRLPNVLPRTLWNHFLDGSGDTVCLTRSQFSDLASAGRRVGNLAPRAGGGYAQQTSYYGGDYANSFGTATLYLDGDRNPTGFHDFYNFDAHGRTSASAQVKTAIGALGYLAGGKDFSVDYNNGDCR